MVSTSFSPTEADIVVVGAGPIGLYEAILAGHLTGKKVVVVERFNEYKRADIRLNIEASSFSGIPDCKPLKELVKKWGKQVPIKEMQEGLTKCANDLGIQIIMGQTVKPAELQTQFPSARVFIGADGARSTMRTEIFGDQHKFNTPLQYLAQLQYMIKTPKSADKDPTSSGTIKVAANSYMKQKFAGHLIVQNIRDQGDGQSQVTLRIFIKEKVYQELAGKATFGTPYYFEKNLNKVPDQLRDTLIKWWGAHSEEQEIIPDEKNKLTVIPLASFAAKDVVKVVKKQGDSDDEVVYALGGDASQFYPWFRSANNGFILVTELAKCTGKAFETLKEAEAQNSSPDAAEKQRRAKLFASRFNAYSRYSTLRAYIERIRAFVKNFFISLSNFWIKISNHVPWQTIKISAANKKKFYERGAEVWKKLSGVEAPPYVAPTLKSSINASFKAIKSLS